MRNFHLIGVSTAKTKLFSTGAEKGPEAIRQAGGFEFPDIPVRTLSKEIKEIISINKIPLVIGGDHSISLPICKAFSEKFTFVVFDAHPDLFDNVYEAHPEVDKKYDAKFTHATVTRRVSELPNCEKVVVVGSRVIEKAEKEFLEKTDKVELVSLEDFKPPKGKLYLSIDLDVLDPEAAPGVDWTISGGCSLIELLTAVGKLNFNNLLGVDLVELVPDNDSSGKTEKCAVKILEFLVN